MFDSLRSRTENKFYRMKLRTASFAALNMQAQPGFNPRLRELYARSGHCFIHIPKNGGTTVERLFYDAKVGHRTWYELHSMAPLDYQRWLKFCVIREPVDRFLSSYDYLRRGGRNPIDAEIGRRFVQKFDINAFVAQLGQPGFCRQLMQYFHFRPQSEFILSADGHCMVNRLVPFSRLSEQMAAMLELDIADIEHRNKTTGARTPPEALTAASLAAIESLYASDFDLHAALEDPPEDFYLQRFAAGNGARPQTGMI